MTAEFHRKIIEIQKAVRQRELHRLELERELMLSARRKERNYDRLCSRLQALKLELLQDEQATNRRIDGLIARVGALEKEYETTIKMTLEFKAKKKQFQLRRSLTNILRSPLNRQISVPERAMFDSQGFNITKANKETQTDYDTLFIHNNQLSTSQNGREALKGPPTSFIGSIKNQRRSSDSFLHHQRPLLKNYTPPFSSSFDNLDASMLDDSFYTGTYEMQSRRERTKSLGPVNAPLLPHISNNYGLGGFENTFQMPSNTEYKYINKQNIYNESVTEDASPNLCTQGHNNHSRPSHSISEEHKAEMNYSIQQDEEENLNGEYITSKKLSINTDCGKITFRPNTKTDQSTEQLHQKQILSSKATNSNENSSSSNNQHLNSSKEETKPKPLKLVSFSTPNLIKKNTKSLYEGKVRSETSNVDATTAIQNIILPSEVTPTSAERNDNFILPKKGNNSVTSDQVLKTQQEFITSQEKTVKPLKLINETATKITDIPKKIAETALESIDTPKKVSETTITEISNKIAETKTHSEHPTIDKNRQSVLATTKSIFENALLYSKETSNKDANLKDSIRIKDSKEPTDSKGLTDSKDLTDSKHIKDTKDPTVSKYSKAFTDSKGSKDVEGSKVETHKDDIQLTSGAENQLNSSSLNKEETPNESKVKSNVKEKQDLDILNTTTQKKKKDVDDDMDFFDEEIPLKETSAYQRMLGVLPGMGYQPPNMDDKMSLNSPKATIRIATRWGASPDGSEGGARPSDTESIDSVEAAIQASMSAKKVSPKENHDVDSSPELKPLSPKSSPEAPPPKINFGSNLHPAKAPVKLNLDSESESYSMSAGGASEDDDFGF